MNTLSRAGIACVLALQIGCGKETPYIVPSSEGFMEQTRESAALPLRTDAHLPAVPIDLENIALPGVRVIDKKTFPGSARNVAVALETHVRTGDFSIHARGLAEQPPLYDASVTLVKAGFRHVYAEGVPTDADLAWSLAVFRKGDPALTFDDLRGVQDYRQAESLVRKGYMPKGIDTSVLVGLTFPGIVEYRGCETTASAIRAAVYADTLSDIDKYGDPRNLAFLERSYRHEQDGAALEFLVEYNKAIDMVRKDFSWFMEGRSKEMLSNALQHADEALVFAGQNHYRSMRDHMRSSNINYLFFCADCDAQVMTSNEREFRRMVNSLKKAKIPKL